MPGTGAGPRFDRTIRVVMWLDALLSLAVALVCIVAVPVVALLGAPGNALEVLGPVAIGLAVVLAGCGAVTAVLLAIRMADGEYRLPPGLRLPLPAAMRPPVDGHR
ncbi:MAG: hypothetical protein ACRDPH_07520 [Marmoricola sp.]